MSLSKNEQERLEAQERELKRLEERNEKLKEVLKK